MGTMIADTMNAQTIERQNLNEIINTLSDSAVEKLASYAVFLRYEDETPNAKTAAAIEAAFAGETQHARTRREFFDAMNSDD